MFRHSRINFFGQADEPRIETMLARLPRKVVGIERDAMATNAWPRIKRHEAKWFGCCRTDHFPRVDVQRVTESRHFIRHADVHRTESIFEKLCCFGDTR